MAKAGKCLADNFISAYRQFAYIDSKIVRRLTRRPSLLTRALLVDDNNSEGTNGIGLNGTAPQGR